MNDERMRDLVRVRLEKAEELLEDAEGLLERESFCSANNRAFYASERAIKAVLASLGQDVASRNGIIRVFNQVFIHDRGDYFTQDDLRKLQKIERIRNASDYDDFYLADKQECRDQVRKAREIVKKVEAYLKEQGILK
ncbi:MAG: HEPN domain-containing protein [Clostridia bacterium]|nr:HEPN domain-containing protein [Clostridia bacterium]